VYTTGVLLQSGTGVRAFLPRRLVKSLSRDSISHKLYMRAYCKSEGADFVSEEASPFTSFAACYFKRYTVSSACRLSAVAFFQVLKIQVRSAVKARLRRLNMMRRTEVTGAHSSGIGTQARRMGAARQGVEDVGRT
jgi:hypothetical protein